MFTQFCRFIVSNFIILNIIFPSSRLVCKYRDIGDNHYQYGNYFLAEKSYSQAIEHCLLNLDENTEKQMGFVYHQRSFARMKVGKYQEALSDAWANLLDNPRNIMAHIISGICFISLGNESSSNQSMINSRTNLSKLNLIVRKMKSTLQIIDGQQVASYLLKFPHVCWMKQASMFIRILKCSSFSVCCLNIWNIPPSIFECFRP